MPVGPLPLALPEMTIRTSTDEGARAVDGNRDLATTLFFYRECPPPRITPHPSRFFVVAKVVYLEQNHSTLTKRGMLHTAAFLRK